MIRRLVARVLSWRWRSWAALVLLALGSTASQSALVSGSAGVVTDYYAYAQYGDGFWLRASDPGFKSVYATLLLAYSTKATVHLWVQDDVLWPGTSARACLVYAILLM